MDQKIGRNDPCPCGSGKKYKQCCLNKPLLAKKIKRPVWLNKPQTQEPSSTGAIKEETPHLIERAFSHGITATEEEHKPFRASLSLPSKEEKKEDSAKEKKHS